MTVGGRVYEIIRLIFDEVGHHTSLLYAADNLQADLGEEDCQHILKYQKDIPPELQGKINFVFTGWSCPGKRLDVACVEWKDGTWRLEWIYLGNYWFEDDCGLRRL